MSNSRYKTHTGREFNMSAFAEKNGDTRAVGNASMNARGDIKNNESKTVSLKADESITPVQNNPVRADTPEVVASRDVNTIDGPATEVEYSDGSMQVIPKAQSTPTSL